MTNWSYSFRIRLTLLFGGLSLLIGGAATVYVSHLASARVLEASGGSLRGIARSISVTLAENLRERDREITLLAQSPSLVKGEITAAELRQRLASVQHSYPHYAWIGFADTEGIVRAAAGGLLEGEKVAQRPWFANGLRGAFVGDVHEAVLLAKKIANPNPQEPLRFVDFASPVYDQHGKLQGVLASHALWTWVEEVIGRALQEDSVRDGVDALLVNHKGEILYPYQAVGSVTVPATMPAEDAFGVVEWTSGTKYLTSSVRVKSSTSPDLGWRVVLRQPLDKALAPAAALQHTLLLLGLLASAVFMFLAYRLAVNISRPIEEMAKAAALIEQGHEDVEFPAVGKTREIEGLGQTLRSMAHTLLDRRRALEKSNADLERTVAERTAELVHANRELEKLARRDALTGLNNRLAANERLREEFLRLKRAGTTYAVILMDIDHFKRVNDTYGHETGDQVLKQVAQLIQETARVTDFVARFGGEEFLAILPDTSQDGAQVHAEKLRAAVAAATVPVVGQITLSLGLALPDAADANEDAAVRRADEALYRAKSQGRNQVQAA